VSNLEERVSKALILEKHFNPEKIRNVIKSDIITVLKNYGEIDFNKLDFDIIILEDGSYQIEFKVKLNSLKVFRSF